ncbi:transketolase, partial [Acinetobacter baumannii]
GPAEVAATRAALGWTSPPFELPDEVRAGWDARRRGAAVQADWQARFDAYADAHPQAAAEFLRRMRGELPEGFAEAADAWI